jgi:hypothetical protein
MGWIARFLLDHASHGHHNHLLQCILAGRSCNESLPWSLRAYTCGLAYLSGTSQLLLLLGKGFFGCKMDSDFGEKDRRSSVGTPWDGCVLSDGNKGVLSDALSASSNKCQCKSDLWSQCMMTEKQISGPEATCLLRIPCPP